MRQPVSVLAAIVWCLENPIARFRPLILKVVIIPMLVLPELGLPRGSRLMYAGGDLEKKLFSSYRVSGKPWDFVKIV